MSDLASLADFKNAFFGGSSDKEMEFYKQAVEQGTTPLDLLKSSSPIVIEHVGTNLALPTVNGVWNDVDTTGTAAARNLDVVIPNVKEGQWVSLGLDAMSGAANVTLNLDYTTVVGGVNINRMTDGGVPSWHLLANTLVTPGSEYPYQIQAEDIENGSARFRLQAKPNSGGVARNLLGTFGLSVILTGKGPFG